MVHDVNQSAARIPRAPRDTSMDSGPHRPPRARLLNPATPPRFSTIVLMAGSGAVTLNVILPSLPGLAAHFRVDYGLMQLSVTAYLGVTAVLHLILGPVSDRLGRRRVMLGSYAIFSLATLGCIVAPNIGAFLTFRMCQAFAICGVVLSRATVRDLYPPERAASVLGYVTMGMALVPMVSPAIGGLLDQSLGWRAVFGLMLVIGLGGLWLGWRDWGETAAGRLAPGSIRPGEARELFRDRRFWAYGLCAGTNGGAFFAYVGGAPFVGTSVFGLSPAALGAYFAFTAGGYMLGNFVSGRWAMQLGIDRMILGGTLLTTAGISASILVMATGHGSALSFFGLMTFVGAGNGLVLPNSSVGMMSVRPRLAGTASGIGGAMMLGTGAVLAALAGALLGPGSGAWPLLWIQLAASAASILCIADVIATGRRR